MEKLSNKEIVTLLKVAKANYIYDIKNTSAREGLCYYIVRAAHQIYDRRILCYEIPILIPNFNLIFCKGNKGVYWWPKCDTESRINAFNKLIEYYSCNNIIDKIKFYIKWYIKNHETKK